MASLPIHAFLLLTILFPIHSFFPHKHGRNNGQREGMNPVAMTVINTRKEHWPSCTSN